MPKGSTEHGVLVTFSKAARIGMIGGCAISRDPNTRACTQATQTAVNRGSHTRRKTTDNRRLLFLTKGSTEHGVLVTFSKAARIGMIGGCAISRDPNTRACTQATQTAVNRGSHTRRKTTDNRRLLFLTPATESETL